MEEGEGGREGEREEGKRETYHGCKKVMAVKEAMGVRKVMEVKEAMDEKKVMG